MAARRVQFNIETKIYPSKPEITPPPKQFAEMIINLIKEYHLVDRAMLQSFDDRTLLASKAIEPKLRTVLLTSDNHFDYVKAVKAAQADILSPDFEWLLPEDVTALHESGIKVIPWTVEDAEHWKKLIVMKVDGIITDYPDSLIDYLKKQGLR